MVVFQYSSESWSFSSLFTLIANSTHIRSIKTETSAMLLKARILPKVFAFLSLQMLNRRNKGMTLQSEFFSFQTNLSTEPKLPKHFFLIQFKT